MSIIKATNVRKKFGEKEVLKGLTLEVNAGETVVILGRSGVGKSVLLRELIGIDKPDSGMIEVDGIPISDLSGRELFKAIHRMGMLFQHGALFDSLTVYANTAFYLHQHPDPISGRFLPEDEVRDRVAHALQMVDLEDTEELMPSSLSGGMRKRAALARLIVYRPKILLYDEPTTGLDPITSHQINTLISATQKELNATSIVVTHDVRSALSVADRLALHHEGRIVVIDTPREFLNNDHPVIQQFVSNAVMTGDIESYLKENQTDD